MVVFSQVSGIHLVPWATDKIFSRVASVFPDWEQTVRESHAEATGLKWAGDGQAMGRWGDDSGPAIGLFGDVECSGQVESTRGSMWEERVEEWLVGML